MKRLIALAAIALSLAAPAPAQADAPCQPVAGDVIQQPNGTEHKTQLHATAHTTACLPRSWAQVSAAIQQLQPDGSWLEVAAASSAPKYVSPTCRNFGCRSASVAVDRNPCISGTFRAVASASGAVNIGPTASLVCFQDPA